MSLDLYVYLKEDSGFSPKGFEAFCRSLNLQVHIPPDFDIREGCDRVPLTFTSDAFSETGKAESYSTGFELFVSDYEYSPCPVEKPRTEKPVGFLQRLFSKKRREEVPEEVPEELPQETPFEQAIKDCQKQLALVCHSGDSFELLMAYLFGAYLVDSLGGILDDPQTGRYFQNSQELKAEIASVWEYLHRLSDSGELEYEKIS